MRNQGFFKIILLEINMLKLHILTEKWSFLGDKTTNGRKCAGFGINDLGCGEGNFRSFGGGSVAHGVRYGMVECVPARMNKKTVETRLIASLQLYPIH